jgi:hypothetical protein
MRARARRSRARSPGARATGQSRGLVRPGARADRSACVHAQTRPAGVRARASTRSVGGACFSMTSTERAAALLAEDGQEAGERATRARARAGEQLRIAIAVAVAVGRTRVERRADALAERGRAAGCAGGGQVGLVRERAAGKGVGQARACTSCRGRA